jgi:iron-sulfur cluster insertion protein
MITVTPNAASRIRAIGKSAESLRVSVNGGGCSGFSYGFELTGERNDDDLVLERDGATVLIDSVSRVYLEGSEIDFVDDLIGQAFKIRNPNAKTSCGCGVSFSL